MNLAEQVREYLAACDTAENHDSEYLADAKIVLTDFQAWVREKTYAKELAMLREYVTASKSGDWQKCLKMLSELKTAGWMIYGHRAVGEGGEVLE